MFQNRVPNRFSCQVIGQDLSDVGERVKRILYETSSKLDELPDDLLQLSHSTTNCWKFQCVFKASGWLRIELILPHRSSELLPQKTCFFPPPVGGTPWSFRKWPTFGSSGTLVASPHSHLGYYRPPDPMVYETRCSAYSKCSHQMAIFDFAKAGHFWPKQFECHWKRVFLGWPFVHGDRDDHRYPISGPMQGIFQWRVKIQGTGAAWAQQCRVGVVMKQSGTWWNQSSAQLCIFSIFEPFGNIFYYSQRWDVIPKLVVEASRSWPLGECKPSIYPIVI